MQFKSLTFKNVMQMLLSDWICQGSIGLTDLDNVTVAVLHPACLHLTTVDLTKKLNKKKKNIQKPTLYVLTVAN